MVWNVFLSGDRVLSTPGSVGGSVVTAWLPGYCMQLLARSGARHPAAGGWARVLGTVAAHLSGAPGQWSCLARHPRLSSASATGLFREYCKYLCTSMSKLRNCTYQWAKQQRTLKGVSTMDLLVLTEDPFHLLRQRLMHT